jgi:hypothetical protein
VYYFEKTTTTTTCFYAYNHSESRDGPFEESLYSNKCFNKANQCTLGKIERERERQRREGEREEGKERKHT